MASLVEGKRDASGTRADAVVADTTTPSLCSWLLEKKAESAVSAITGGDLAATNTSHASVSQIMNYLRTGEAAELHDCVVRDIHFVTIIHKDDEKKKAVRNNNDEEEEEGAEDEAHAVRVQHAVLDDILHHTTTNNDDNTHAKASTLARLRYAQVAASLHPITVFLLLDVYGNNDSTVSCYADNEAEGLVLALASLLSSKAGLHTSLSGTLHRASELRVAARDYFTARLPTRLHRLRYAALLCRTTCSAIANGALQAASLLCAVSDMAVLHAFGLTNNNSEESSESDIECEVRRLEAEVMESIDFIHQYAEWALRSAATSLGVVSAHVGMPSNATKEASLRDGRAHPIVTSRTVEIEPLKLARPAYATATSSRQ